MEGQGIPLERISSPGAGTDHSRIGPSKVAIGSGVGTGAKTREGKEGEIDGRKNMAHYAEGSGPTHQRGREPEQPPTSDPELPATDKPLSVSAPNGARRAMNGVATKVQEPTDTTLVQHVDEPATGGRVQQKAPPGLSQRAEFWERYDKLADIIDKKLSENLNGNLDVLLIFAALFSAINTAFISITMTDLSPDKSDKTNALLELLVKRVDNSTLTPSDLTPPFSPQLSSIVVNFLLYASLCCSLLAAMGAMLGKEWLQSFDRTGQTGLSEEQGRLRQSKFNGIKDWHLEGSILFLPNLLVFSVALFFAGLAVYLFPINKAVSGLLIAVLGLALGVWLVTVLAGAIWPLCPYQSAASRALRSVGLYVASYRTRVRRPSGNPMKSSVGETLGRWKDSLRRFTARSPSNWRLLASPTREDEAGNGSTITEEQISNAQAVGWLMETTSSRGDRLAAAKFIITFDDAGCESVLQNQGACQRLLRLARETFESWQVQPTDANREMLEGFARALSRIVLFRPEVATDWNSQIDGANGQQRGVFESFLFGLEMAATGTTDTDFLAHAAFLHALEATQNLYSKSRSWEKLLVSMSKFDISLLDKHVTSAGYNAAHVLRSLQRSHSETNAIEIYSSFLQEIRHVATPDQLQAKLASLLVYSLIEFMFDVHGSPNVNQGSSDHELDKFSVDALLALRAIISRDSLPTSPRHSFMENHWFDSKTSWRSSSRSWEQWNLEDFWRVIDLMIVKLGRSSPAIEKLAPDFVLVTVEWLALSLQLTGPMDKFEKHPNVVASVIAGLTDHRPQIRERWMQLFTIKEEGRPRRIPRRFVWWRDAGLDSRLAERLNHPRTRKIVWEVLDAFKTIDGEMPKEVLAWLWDTCDRAITEPHSPKPEGQSQGPESVLEMFEWLSKSLLKRQQMDGLETHPSIAASVASGLAEETPESQARWLNLCFVNRERWFKPSLNSLWRDVGLGARLVEMLREPQTWGKDARLLDVVKSATYNSFYWTKKLVHKGLPLAAADAILHIDNKRERLHPGWKDLLGRAVEVMLEAWNDTKDDPEIQWPTQEMLVVIRPSSVYIKKLLASEEKIADVLRFVQLIKYLQERLPLSAFISCNADIVVRSVFAQLEKRAEVIYPLQSACAVSQQIIWDYRPYGLSEAASVCSRPYVFDEQIAL
ncbi:hypothetical protein FRC05_011433 [Tulasnella sp. 425]|nr:hypothetical protein FRC05_011433 [Tulasnella sp. 425]